MAFAFLYSKGVCMKFSRYAVLMTGLLASTLSFANLEGSWKVSEDGQPKAILKFTKTGDTYSAVMAKGLTEKAKKRENKGNVMYDIKDLGGGKYQGKGKHPTLPLSGKVDITVNGNTITIKSKAGTQTGVRQ